MSRAPFPSAMPPAVAASKWAAVSTLVLLIGLGLAWELGLAPTGHRTLAIKVLPLTAALPGPWRNRLYTYRWLSLLVWVYVAEAAVRLGSDRGLSRGLAAAELLLCVLLFAACAAHVRLRLAGARAVTALGTA